MAAGNKPINKHLRGIRDSIPAGYVVGRAAGGSGPPILLPVGQFATKGYVANTTIVIGAAAGGDLGGTYPNPTVTGIQGNPVSASAPSNGQVLEWNGADWVPTTPLPIGASIADTGSAIELALSDSNGELILDSMGRPIFMTEVFPAVAIPLDNTTIKAAATGLIGTLFSGFYAQMTANQPVSDNVITKAVFDTLLVNTLGTQYSTSTGLFTPTKAGKYLCWANAQGVCTTQCQQINAWLSKNGTIGGTGVNNGVAVIGPEFGTSTLSTTGNVMSVITMNGSSDTLEVDCRVNGTGGGDAIAGANGTIFFGVVYLGA